MIGLSLFETNRAQITGNTISNNFTTGILLAESNNNTISGNTVKTNGNSGIQMNDGSSGNTITKNVATGNGIFGGYDLLDNTSGGTGTAGTLNTWSSNTFDLAHPQG